MVDQILPSTVLPIILLIACLAVEAGMLRIGIDDLDEGYFVQQGVRVLHGQVPFRDFVSLYPPGQAYAHAALFALTGGPSLIAARVLALAARAGIAGLLFVLARPFVRNPWWAAVPGLVLLLGLDDAPVRWEPHPGWLSTLFALLAVWCLTHRPTARWLIAAGVATALTYLFKQNTGIYILIVVVLWCWWYCRARAVVPLLSFGAVTLLWFAPLVVAGGVRLDRFGVLVGAVNQSSLFSPPEASLLIPFAALIGGVWLLRRDSHPHLRWYLLAGVALLATEFPRMDTLHLVWAAPLLLVVGAIALDRLAWPLSVASLAAVVVLLAPTWTDRLAYLAEPRAAVISAGVDAPAQTASDTDVAVAQIQQHSAPGEPIFAYPTSPLLYVLADRPNPTEFDHLNPGAATPAQINQVIDDLAANHVRLVVISDFWESVWGEPGANAVLEEWLNAHYVEVARAGAYRILAASSL